MLSLEQLQREYGTSDSGFVEITDRAQAISDLESKTSCCWGAGFEYGNSGWIQLASPSKRHRDDKRTIFVCKKTLLEEPKLSDREKDIWTIRAMIDCGGHFVSNLGKAAQHADSENLAKIKAAWPEYWSKYAEMGESMQKADAAKEQS